MVRAEKVAVKYCGSRRTEETEDREAGRRGETAPLKYRRRRKKRLAAGKVEVKPGGEVERGTYTCTHMCVCMCMRVCWGAELLILSMLLTSANPISRSGGMLLEF